jgi:hypothetical protein
MAGVRLPFSAFAEALWLVRLRQGFGVTYGLRRRFAHHAEALAKANWPLKWPHRKHYVSYGILFIIAAKPD